MPKEVLQYTVWTLVPSNGLWRGVTMALNCLNLHVPFFEVFDPSFVMYTNINFTKNYGTLNVRISAFTKYRIVLEQALMLNL